MNKRNELRDKLHACHIQQQQQQTRGGTAAGGPSAVNQIPKAKRPAAVAAIAATVPKKMKMDHRMHNKHLQQQHHQFAHHQQQKQQPIAATSSSASSATSFSGSANAALSTALEQQRQQHSLLLVREAAECAASAVDDAAGDVVVEECGGGGVGAAGPFDQFLRSRTASTAMASTSDFSLSAGHRSNGRGAEDDQQQQQQQQPVSAPGAGGSGAEAWLYSTDGRLIDDAIAELSLDNAISHLCGGVGTAVDHPLSAEAVLRLVARVAQCVGMLTNSHIRLLFPALRAHRLKGAHGAEKLLMLLIKRRKHLDGESNQLQHFPLSAFTRPPPTKIVETPTDATDCGDAIIDQQNAAKDNGGTKDGKESVVKNEADDEIVLLKEAKAGKKPLGRTTQTTTAAQNGQLLANKSADELLQLLLSDAKMDEQKQHFVLTELLHKRPDLVDMHAPNFDGQLHALFSCRLSVARALVAHQLAHCASASLIKRSVTLLLNSFNSSFCAPSVVAFVAKVCGAVSEEDTKVGPVLSGEQCFVLALYVLEDIEQCVTPDMKEAAFSALDSVRLFCSVLANVLRRSHPTPLLSVSAPSAQTLSADLLETFTRCYRAHANKLWHAKASSSLFCLSGGDRRRHGLNMLYQTVCSKFPTVPSKCLFVGMFAATSNGTVQPNRAQHITRSKFDRLITGVISEIFELIIKVGKGGPEVDLALDKAHQLVQHFRNCRDVQFSRYMPLLCSKVQQLVDSLAGRELKNSPHCALLLFSLDLITVALRNNLSGTDDDDEAPEEAGEGTKNGHGKNDENETPTPPLIQTVAIALQTLLRHLQQNRRSRQIQSLCEKVCNAVVQLLKFDNIVGESTRRRHRRRLSDGGANSTGQLLCSYGVLLGELADWKALNVPGRAILKRTVTNMATQID